MFSLYLLLPILFQMFPHNHKSIEQIIFFLTIQRRLKNFTIVHIELCSLNAPIYLFFAWLLLSFQLLFFNKVSFITCNRFFLIQVVVYVLTQILNDAIVMDGEKLLHFIEGEGIPELKHLTFWNVHAILFKFLRGFENSGL